MAFDIAQIDAVPSTMRAVAASRSGVPGPDEIITRCIDLAEQAPSGGNITSRRWLVIRDPEAKAEIANLYREAGAARVIQQPKTLKAAARIGSGRRRQPRI